MRRLLTVLVSFSMLLLSFFPFVRLGEAKQIDAGSVKSTTGVVLVHGSQLHGYGTMMAQDHDSHWSHESHESHSSHYSSN
jgi:hypothetical protein